MLGRDPSDGSRARSVSLPASIAGVSVLFALGCGPRVSMGDLPPEPSGAAGGSVLLAFAGTDERWEIGANAAGGALIITGAEDADRAVLLVYREDLESLSIARGRVDPATAPCQRPCAMLRPAAAYEAALGAALADGRLDAADWTETNGLPVSLVPLLVADPERCQACATYDVSAIQLDSAERVRFVGDLEGGGAILALGDGRVLKVSEGGAVSDVCRFVGGVDAGFHARGDARVYLTGRGGFGWFEPSLARGGEPCPARSLDPLPWTDVTGWMSGPPIGTPFELFALSDQGAVAYFDGGRWSLIGTFELEPDDQVAGYIPRAAIGWLAPGEAAIAAGTKQLIWARSSTITAERVIESGLSLRIDSLAATPSHGLLLAVNVVGLMVNRAGRWEPIAPNGRMWRQTSFVRELDGRVLFSSTGGLLGQYAPDTGYCPDFDTKVYHSHARPAQLAPGRLLLADAMMDDTPDTSLTSMLILSDRVRCPARR